MPGDRPGGRSDRARTARRQLEAIARLRRLAAGDAAWGDLTWLTDRIARYLEHAPGGFSLEQALDLEPGPGGERWWTIMAREHRDQALRALAEELAPGRSTAAKARAVHEHLAGRGAGRAFPGKKLPGRRQLASILGNRPGAVHCMEADE